MVPEASHSPSVLTVRPHDVATERGKKSFDMNENQLANQNSSVQGDTEV